MSQQETTENYSFDFILQWLDDNGYDLQSIAFVNVNRDRYPVQLAGQFPKYIMGGIKINGIAYQVESKL